MEIGALEQGVAGGERGGEWKMIGLIEDPYDGKSSIYIEKFCCMHDDSLLVCDCECIQRRRC